MERKKLITVVVSVVAGVFLLAAFISSRQPRITVRVAAATREDITNTISTNGKVEPVEDFQAHAPAATTVKRVLVHAGDWVKTGQLLVVLDDAEARATAARAAAQLTSAEADLHAVGAGGRQEEVIGNKTALVKAQTEFDAAKRNLDALQRLQQNGAASESEVEVAQNRFRAADSAVKAAQQLVSGRYSRPEVARVQAQAAEAKAALDAANDLLANSNIRAPRDGMVYALPVRASAYVNSGDLVVAVADLKKIQVRTFVDEPDIGRLSKGQQVQISWDAISGRTWIGTVTRVPTSVTVHGSRNVGEVVCEVDNGDLKLLPNVNVNVTVITAMTKNALTIPREAVRQEKGEYYVFSVVDDTLKRVPVKTSVTSLTRIQVTNGLKDGDKVAVSTVFGHPMNDGQPVKTAE
jgi:HlyD family secretion protein